MPSEAFDNLVSMFKAQRTGTVPPWPDLRTNFDMLGQMVPVAEGVEVQPTTLAGMKAERLSVPIAPKEKVILYLHGGGYCIGSVDSHRPIAAALAAASKVTVVLPEYRLAPEDPFPAAVDDALAAYRALLEEGFAANDIVVGGESAGGGLTVALMIALRDAGGPLPAGAFLISPWCDMNGLGDVSPEALDVDFLRPEQIAAFTEAYIPDGKIDALNSPATADLRGLPPLLIQGGEHEILVSQIRKLADKAKADGVDVTVDIASQMFHAWPLFAMLPEAQEATAEIASFVSARLS